MILKIAARIIMIPITQLMQGEGNKEGTGFIYTQTHKEIVLIERIFICSEWV